MLLKIRRSLSPAGLKAWHDYITNRKFVQNSSKDVSVFRTLVKMLVCLEL